MLSSVHGRRVPPRGAGCRSAQGFTLIEVIVTLTIAAILFGLAMPGLKTFIQNARITTATNDFLGDLMLARSEALKRGDSVTICARDPGAPTLCGPAASPNWRNGRILWIDTDNDGLPGAGETVIKYREPTESNLTFLTNDASFKTSLVLMPNGSIKLPTPPSALGYYFKICDERGNNAARAIVFKPVGPMRVSRETTYTTGPAVTGYVSCP